MRNSNFKKKFVFFLIFAGIATLLLILVPSFIEAPLKDYVSNFFGANDGRMGVTAAVLFDQLLRIV
ncbi:MAG: hypothetical protein H0X15_15225, partial [Acidobacteria bacterium]|nr:hypothetical protein [Acidobacteriota bacterium]